MPEQAVGDRIRNFLPVSHLARPRFRKPEEQGVAHSRRELRAGRCAERRRFRLEDEAADMQADIHGSHVTYLVPCY
jgi:hypothetical protein